MEIDGVCVCGWDSFSETPVVVSSSAKWSVNPIVVDVVVCSNFLRASFFLLLLFFSPWVRIDGRLSTFSCTKQQVGNSLKKKIMLFSYSELECLFSLSFIQSSIQVCHSKATLFTPSIQQKPKIWLSQVYVASEREKGTSTVLSFGFCIFPSCSMIRQDSRKRSRE